MAGENSSRGVQSAWDFKDQRQVYYRYINERWQRIHYYLTFTTILLFF